MTKITADSREGAEVTNQTSCNIIQSSSSSSSTSSGNINQQNNPANDKSRSRDDSTGNKSHLRNNYTICLDYDLRPKFGIFKHKTEIINQKTINQSKFRDNSNSPKKQQKPITPGWFFNIPNTRSPFPDFGSKLPPEDN